jgi:uncharacterized membrane protein
MFTDLYLKTTNPKLKFKQLFTPSIFVGIIGSVIFHTFIYTLLLNLVNYIYFKRNLSRTTNIRLIISLTIIMFFGFFGRFLHVKEIYKSYNYNLERTREYIDKHYISWVFLS